MVKPIIKENSFSVEDIHKIREYHYETTKTLSRSERIKEINERANRVSKATKQKKLKKKSLQQFNRIGNQL